MSLQSKTLLPGDIPICLGFQVGSFQLTRHNSDARCCAVITGDKADCDEASISRTVPNPVKSACVQCQKRKIKCTGQRPICGSCHKREDECSWDVADGMTRTQDLKAKITDATNRADDLAVLINGMRFGTDEESTMLLAQLRMGASTRDLARMVRESNPGLMKTMVHCFAHTM